MSWRDAGWKGRGQGNKTYSKKPDREGRGLSEMKKEIPYPT
jgi:hypothetical protein